MLSQGSQAAFGDSLRAFAFGLLAAGLGDALFGEAGGVASAVAVGMATSSRGGCVYRIALGGCWGAKSASLEQILNGSQTLLLMNALAGGFAILCFAECVHVAWRVGPEHAEVEYTGWPWNGPDHRCDSSAPATDATQVPDAAAPDALQGGRAPHFEETTKSSGVFRDRLTARQ
jgi:hypothetical protein